MLKATNECSWKFQETTNLLDNGWHGTYGQLAVRLQRTSRSVLLAVRMVQAYALRNPAWPRSRVHRQGS